MVRHQDVENLIWGNKAHYCTRNEQLDRLIKWQLIISILMCLVAFRDSYGELYRHLIVSLIGLIYYRSTFLYVKAAVLWTLIQCYTDILVPIKSVFQENLSTQDIYVKLFKVLLQVCCSIYYSGVLVTVLRTALKRKPKRQYR